MMSNPVDREKTNPVFDFSADDHAVMLQDQVRLEAFKQAVTRVVKPGDVVTEIGTGTGILAAFAASVTKAPVFAIEYSEVTAKIAEQMFKGAGYTHVKVLRGQSYGITVEPSPDVLVTETIGAIGPEEHTVEICHDFKQRHPKLSKIIPSDLRVYAEPVSSKKLKRLEAEFYRDFESASFDTFQYSAIKPVLEQKWSEVIRFGFIPESEIAGSRVLLADYQLGVTEKPDFKKEIEVPEGADAIHLYFEAQMDPELILSTHYSDAFTHWKHAFVPCSKAHKRLRVSYEGGSQTLQIEWI